MTDSEGNEIGKLFIGGLSQSTTSESMLTYFSQYGEVDEAVVMMDNRTGRSRGFGYVKYKNSDILDTVLDSKPHILDNKEIDAKQCNVNMKGKNRRSLKIFVGGIALDQEAETIRKYFEQYGNITDVSLMMDPAKQRHRGFAFVGFEDENVVKRLIAMHYITMNGKQVEIKAMEPPNYGRKSSPTPPNMPPCGFNSKSPNERSIGHPNNQQTTWRHAAPYPQQPVNWPTHSAPQMWSQPVWPQQWQQSAYEQPQWSAGWSYPNTSWYQPSPTPVYPPQNGWAPAAPPPMPMTPSQPQTTWTATQSNGWDAQQNTTVWTQPQPPHTHPQQNDFEQEYNDQKSSPTCSVSNGPYSQLASPDYNNWIYGSKDMKIMSIGVESETQAPPPGGSGDYSRTPSSTAYPYHIRR